MSDSYVEMDLRFSENADLRTDVVGGNTKVRWGKLLEHFDSCAGAAAYKHVLHDGASVADAAKYGIYLVTAAVEVSCHRSAPCSAVHWRLFQSP